MRTERESAEFADFLGGPFGKFGMRVEAGADSGAANGEVVEAVAGLRDASEVAVEHTDPAGKFLLDGEGCRVLQMRAAYFDDLAELFCFGVESVAEFLDGGEKTPCCLCGRGNVHGGGESVVGGLRHIYIVVWMD